MEKQQVQSSQAQPCYESVLKSLLNLFSKSLHLFRKDCNGVLKCGVFCLIVRNGCKGGNSGSGRCGRRGGDGTSGSSALRGRFSLKASKTYLGEVASAAAVIADRRTRVLLQAVFVRLRAAATTAILHLFVPLFDNVLVEQSLEVRINVVGIDVHRVGIAKTRGRARSQR
jgi:hypothetical protein